jgi:hypothetical protein
MDDSDQQPLVGLPVPVAGSALDRAYVEAVAHRVAELIRDDAHKTAAPRLVDAATLAAELGVERSWVYEHAHQLHPIRLGSGPRARLRFNPDAVHAILDGQAADSRQTTANGHRPKSASRARRSRPKSKPGRVLAVRPRGAS